MLYSIISETLLKLVEMKQGNMEQQKLKAIQTLVDQGCSAVEIEQLCTYLSVIIEPLFDEYFDRPYEEFLKQIDDLCL